MVITAELWHYRYSDDHLLREAIMANNYNSDHSFIHHLLVE